MNMTICLIYLRLSKVDMFVACGGSSSRSSSSGRSYRPGRRFRSRNCGRHVCMCVGEYGYMSNVLAFEQSGYVCCLWW